MDEREGNPSKSSRTPNPSKSPKPRCTAQTSRGHRGPCRNYPIYGSTVCRAHGGAAPQVRAAADRRLAMNDALAELARRGIPPVDNPLEALAEVAGEIVAVKDIIRERISRLQEEAWRYEDLKGGEQIRSEVLLYERALDRSARVLEGIARLKIDERLAAITEQQGQTLATVITSVLERLDLGAQAARVRDLVAAELEQLAA